LVALVRPENCFFAILTGDTTRAFPRSATAVHRFGDPLVTIDKSLRRKGRLARSRNVLKRDERISLLQVEERWTPGRSPLGLPKVRAPKSAAGKKKKKKAKEEADTTAAAAEATPAATGKAGAPAAKAAGAAKSAAPAKPASGKK
jgi:small basic protein (TIGR04137 family)